MRPTSRRRTRASRCKPIYAGTYQETIVKALTAHKSGKPPTTSVLLSTDMFTLIDEDAIVPIDDFVKTDDDKAWLKSFFPAFMVNSQTGGKTWGVPFQRSTVVLYWNKELFKEAGLDPDKAPANWAEQVAFAQKLTKRDALGQRNAMGHPGAVLRLPLLAVPGLTTQAGAMLMNEDGNATFYDKPEVVEALKYWVDLSRKHKVHPPGIVEWGTTPKDFFEKKTAMMWTTTGNLTNVRNNAKFPFGVAMLPAGKRRGSPTGGGNFYISKKAPPAQQEARSSSSAGSPRRSARPNGASNRLRGRAPGRVRDAGDQEVCRRIPAGRRGARPAAIRRRRAVDAREPARHQGAERRPAGGADRHQAAGAGDEGRAGRGGAHPEPYR